MNIANIFGLYLGCRVKIPNGKIFKIDQIYRGKGTGRPMITDNEQDMNLYIEHCKLILKPLSAITDEDKAEFMEKFWNYDHFYILEKLDDERVYYKDAGSETIYSRKYFVTEALFLSTKGYKIEGIVPDEYCEVEE